MAVTLPSDDSPCLCQSKKTFAACCARYLRGEALAPDPATLMRSRYSAFCLGDLAYLKKTWSEDTYPEDLAADEPANWVSLEILDSSVEGTEGEVEFRAGLIFKNKLEILHEISSFDLVEGAWLYHSGEFQNEDAKPKAISANAPCPCGSGQPFKHCHFER